MMKPYQFRPGSKESGNAWSSIADDLNTVTEVIFYVSQKSVRDRFTGSDTMAYLKQHAEQELEICQQEIELKSMNWTYTNNSKNIT